MSASGLVEVPFWLAWRWRSLEKRTRQSRLMPGRAGSSGEVGAYATTLVCWRCDDSSRPPWPLHLGRLFNRPQLSGHPQHEVLDDGCDDHVDGRTSTTTSAASAVLSAYRAGLAAFEHALA